MSRNSPHFIEPKSSLPHSQEPYDMFYNKPKTMNSVKYSTGNIVNTVSLYDVAFIHCHSLSQSTL